MSDQPATQRQYVAQVTLTAALMQAIRQLWAATSPLSAPGAMRTFRGGVAALVDQFSQASASVAADYYATIRREAGVPGEPRLTVVEPPPPALVRASLDWAERAAESPKVKADLERVAAETEARVLQRVEAAMQKVMTDQARDRIIEAVDGDDRALGYRRVPRPGACYWCIALALRTSTRGTDGERHQGVYKSRATAGQGDDWHNNCHCVVEPVFSTGVLDVPDWLADMERLYADATKDSNPRERLNDFRRALAALRRGEDPIPDPIPTLSAVKSNDERLGLLSDLLADLDVA